MEPIYRKIIGVTSMRHLEHKMQHMMDEYKKVQSKDNITVIKESLYKITVLKNKEPVLSIIFVVIPVVVNTEKLLGYTHDSFTRFDFTNVYRAIDDAKKRLRLMENPLAPYTGHEEAL